MRFGQNAVKTPGRTHDNDCVTKGVKFRAALFKGLGVAHVGRSPRPEDPKGLAPLGHRSKGNAFGRPSHCARRRVSERNRRRRLLARRSGETPQNEPNKKGRAKNREAKKGRNAILS